MLERVGWNKRSDEQARCPKRTSRHRLSRMALALAGLASALIACGKAWASEFGVGSYRPGIIDLYAGYSAPPGATILKPYFLFQDASAHAIAEGGRVVAASRTVTYTDAVFAAHETDLSMLGSFWGFGAIMQFRLADQSLRVG